MQNPLQITHLDWSPEQWDVRRKGHLLRDISLSVRAGEFVGLVGPNGSGKTSLLRCAFRCAKPRGGRVSVMDKDIWATSARWVAQHVAVLLQELPYDLELTGEQVVRMARTPYKRVWEADHAEDERLAIGAMCAVGLDRDRHRRFSTFSGGEKQRLLIARALAQTPALLILDEPTNHLDPKHQIELLQLVKAQGIATLATLHDLNLAAAFCDRVYVLEGGAIVAEGMVQQVFTKENLAAVFGLEAEVDRHPRTGRPRITWVHSI